MGTRVWISDARVYQGGVCNYISVTRSSLIFRWRRTGMNIIRQNGYWYRRTTAVPDKWPCPRVARTRDKFSTPPFRSAKLPCNEPLVGWFRKSVLFGSNFSDLFFFPSFLFRIIVHYIRYIRGAKVFVIIFLIKAIIQRLFVISAFRLLRFLIKDFHFQIMRESIQNKLDFRSPLSHETSSNKLFVRGKR